jgi:hypothetical protein
MRLEARPDPYPYDPNGGLEQYISVRAAASMMDIPQYTVWKLIKNGKIGTMGKWEGTSRARNRLYLPDIVAYLGERKFPKAGTRVAPMVARLILDMDAPAFLAALNSGKLRDLNPQAIREFMIAQIVEDLMGRALPRSRDRSQLASRARVLTYYYQKKEFLLQERRAYAKPLEKELKLRVDKDELRSTHGYQLRGLEDRIEKCLQVE